MEMEDGPLYSADTVCDETINENMVQQPDMPAVPWFKQLWYGLGRVEALYQINHIAIARTHQYTYSAEVVFEPKLKSELKHIADAHIMARARIEKYLKKMGFETKVNTIDDAKQPDSSVRIQLNNDKNLQRMRIFGPYIMFDRNYMLTDKALNPVLARQR